MEITINGKKHRIDVPVHRMLLSVLRDDLGLTGCKYGCGEAQCGACTVLVNDSPIRSCITPILAITGKNITTIEGLETKDVLHPLQEAFIKCGAMQCGYCTSGMIMTGVALLRSNSNPADSEILEFMNGNICRCGTYSRILAAIRLAAETTGSGGRNERS